MALDYQEIDEQHEGALLGDLACLTAEDVRRAERKAVLLEIRDAMLESRHDNLSPGDERDEVQEERDSIASAVSAARTDADAYYDECANRATPLVVDVDSIRTKYIRRERKKREKIHFQADYRLTNETLNQAQTDHFTEVRDRAEWDVAGIDDYESNLATPA